jgi:hypothetical protein
MKTTDRETQIMLERAADALAYNIAVLRNVRSGGRLGSNSVDNALKISGECFEDICMWIDPREILERNLDA